MGAWDGIVIIGPTPTTFAQRIKTATDWEQQVIDHLRADGYAVQPWGQGLFQAEVSRALRHTNSLVRWQPDVLAVLPPGSMYVDAKSRMTDTTPNHAVEIMSHRAHLTRMRAEDVPVIYVWPDWNGEIASRVPIAKAMRGRGTAGSGTDFILIRKTACRPFTEIMASLDLAGTWWDLEAADALRLLDAAVAEIDK